ncbi:MAG: hypothetical protein HQ526_09440 [Actinobacteria bacterium]|nr:hypothetical protein [Actinomycetota bacterium]
MSTDTAATALEALARVTLARTPAEAIAAAADILTDPGTDQAVKDTAATSAAKRIDPSINSAADALDLLGPLLAIHEAAAAERSASNALRANVRAALDGGASVTIAADLAWRSRQTLYRWLESPADELATGPHALTDTTSQPSELETKLTDDL